MDLKGFERMNNYKFRCSLTDKENNKYIMVISKYDDECNMSFINAKEVNYKYLEDSIITIDEDAYNKFFERITSVLASWDTMYASANTDEAWTVILNTPNSEIKYSGRGSYPENWNYFVELLMEYEELFNKQIETRNDAKVQKLMEEEPVKEETPTVLRDVIKEISIEYSIGGLGRYEKTELSGIKELDEFGFGNTNAPMVKILEITNDKVVLEFRKSLQLGSPLKEQCSRFELNEDSYIIEAEIYEEIVFDPFIVPSVQYKFMVTGIYETERLYNE